MKSILLSVLDKFAEKVGLSAGVLYIALAVALVGIIVLCVVAAVLGYKCSVKSAALAELYDEINAILGEDENAETTEEAENAETDEEAESDEEAIAEEEGESATENAEYESETEDESETEEEIPTFTEEERDEGDTEGAELEKKIEEEEAAMQYFDTAELDQVRDDAESEEEADDETVLESEPEPITLESESEPEDLPPVTIEPEVYEDEPEEQALHTAEFVSPAEYRRAEPTESDAAAEPDEGTAERRAERAVTVERAESGVTVVRKSAREILEERRRLRAENAAKKAQEEAEAQKAAESEFAVREEIAAEETASEPTEPANTVVLQSAERAEPEEVAAPQIVKPAAVEELGKPEEAAAREIPAKEAEKPKAKAAQRKIPERKKKATEEERYNVSFRGRLIQDSPIVQTICGELTDELTSYMGVEGSENWRKICFHAGKATVANIYYNQKALTLALAADEKECKGLRGVTFTSRGDTRAVMEIRSDRDRFAAKKVIAAMMTRLGYVKRNVTRSRDYVQPYASDEELVSRGLARAVGRK